MKDGNIAAALRFAFNIETLGRFDVFEVDAAESGRDHLDKANNLLGVGAVDLDVKDVDVGKALEEDGFAFHDRLGGLGAEVAQAENGAAVADHGDQVAFGGIFVGVLRILGDLQHGEGYARRIGERQIGLGLHGLRGDDFELAWTALGVILQCGRFGDSHGITRFLKVGQIADIRMVYERDEQRQYSAAKT